MVINFLHVKSARFRFLLICFFCVIFTHNAQAMGSRHRANTSPQPKAKVQNDFMIIGTEEGLFGFDQQGNGVSFGGGGGVRKIAHYRGEGSGGVWAILCNEGVFVSTDLQNWEKRNQGLPVKTIKLFRDGDKSFLQVVQEIKDLKINPEDPDIMVCATKDMVYLSRDQGRTWVRLGAPAYRTNGIKAVAAAYLPAANGSKTLTVFLSHSVYGVHYIQPDLPSSKWLEISDGIEKLETTDNTDEVSDIAVVGAEIFASQTFRRRIYALDWERKKFNPVWTDNSVFGTVDSLNAGNDVMRFLTDGMAAEIDLHAAGANARTQVNSRQDIQNAILSASANMKHKPNCAALLDKSRQNELVIFNELWLIDEAANDYNAKSSDKEGIYLPVNHAMDSQSLKPYLDIIGERKLNMVVIDMKDDYGRLRFTPKNSAISDKGRVFRPLDIDALLADFKHRGIYSVARIVVFKDPVLAAKDGGKYAVWDKRNNKPWAGYYDREQQKGTGAPEDTSYETVILPSNKSGIEILRTFYDERWVDPFSEEVWEYTAAVAAELYERGFDEIQFDYIRFPTDGENLGDASYRWQENGMDMESAILSFLRHIRSNVNAPISIDIYGANGWYRTGARTGQEVELLAPWVDVICPMYYPSHFEQDFLAQTPAELRPWRIYYFGTLRTSRIGRGRIIVRPYVQAFYLNVSYDRRYYNPEYVRQEVKGVRDAGSGGLTYWNNMGRYDDIPLAEE